MMKVVVVCILLGILGSLASGLFYLLRPQRTEQDRRKLAQALTLRVVLSLALFGLLFLGYVTGILAPQPLMPPPR